MSFQLRNLMKGTAQIVEWSVRDESLHSKAGCWLFRTMMEEMPELNDGIEKCFNTDEGWTIEQVGSKPIQNTSEKMHASGLRGEIAQDHFDQHMYGNDNDLF